MKDSIERIFSDENIAFIKPTLDVHTLGLSSAAEFLKELGYNVIIAPPEIESIIQYINVEDNWEKLYRWIKNNKIVHIGFSFRLEPEIGAKLFIQLYFRLRDNNLLKEQGGVIRKIYFSGLESTNKIIFDTCSDRVIYFKGGESPEFFLNKIGVPEAEINSKIKFFTEYDKNRDFLAELLFKKNEYNQFIKEKNYNYPEFGKENDNLIKRLTYAQKSNQLPLIRAHVGPYMENREQALKLFSAWIKELKEAGYLDILSIGSSQLTQSNFEEDWSGKLNGGGVPINSRYEFYDIMQEAKPMLVRTYAGCKNLLNLAQIYEKYLNIAWHALSFWWFNKLDGRGPLDLLENLTQTFNTIKYIAKTNKPLEANVSHHFAFRGSDDISYIISSYLSAKAAKQLGIKYFIFQNMLNTPNITWGINDISKARAALYLLKTLEDDSFKIIYQPRAGLSYFSPDMEIAKKQLMKVTMLMDDVEYNNQNSPSIIHVVGYSEGQFLENPEVVNESIKITLYTLMQYRKIKNSESLLSKSELEEIQEKFNYFISESLVIIKYLESNYANLYSPAGFYEIFRDGLFPTPYLWAEREKYRKAVSLKTKYMNGGIFLVNEMGKRINSMERIELLKNQIAE